MVQGDEFTPEGEGMIRETIPLAVSVTGSTGTTPIRDSTARGIFLAGIIEGLNLLARTTDLLSTKDIGEYMALATFLAFVLAGAFDRWIKPRLSSA